jgi:hypothetical protein
MAGFVLTRLALPRRFIWPRLLLILLGLGLAFCLSSVIVQAEPVTFRFEAEVTDIDVLFPADLPFAVKVGDRIRGQFSFEPTDVPTDTPSTNTIQNFGVSFELESTELASNDYFLRVRNDNPVVDAPELTTDDIWLGCASSGAESCHPNILQATDNLIWWFSLPLVGDGAVLDGADIPGDPNVWQHFAPGYLALTFQEVDFADVLRITARIDKFSAVPEPTSAVTSLIALLIGSLATASRQHSRRH